MAPAKKKTAVKAKKKKWFTVIAPKQFNEQVIAECPALEMKDLVGKKIMANLMSLTNDPKKQNTVITFLMDGINADKMTTKITGLKLLPPSIKRMVRRGKDRLDLTIKVNTSDNHTVTIKPLVLTKTNAKGSIKTAIHQFVKAYAIKTIAKMTYDNLFKEVIGHQFQKGLYGRLKKIYPIALCEIRYLKLEAYDSKTMVEEAVESEQTEAAQES